MVYDRRYIFSKHQSVFWLFWSRPFKEIDGLSFYYELWVFEIGFIMLLVYNLVTVL